MRTFPNSPTRINHRMGFWSYDLYPFVLGGRGIVEPKSGFFVLDDPDWGPMVIQHPLKVLPMKKGLALLEEIEQCKADYEMCRQMIYSGALRRLQKTAPWVLKKPKPK